MNSLEEARSEVRSAKTSAGFNVMHLVQRVFLTQQPCRAVAFAGIEAESKSAGVCLEAARILAGSVREEVLLIDADLEHPGALDAYSNHRERGLTTAISSADAVRLHTSPLQNSNLSVMLCGPSNGKPLLAGTMRAFLKRALAEFQFVLVHAPSLASSSACIALAQAADGLILVLAAGVTRKAAAIKTVSELESAGITLLGAVLNETSQPVPQFLYQRL